MRRALVVALVVVAASALSCIPKKPVFAIRHAEYRGTLAHNGLRFVIAPDAGTKLVHVAVRYEVGSNDDPPGKAGLAHLVEHMLFQTRPDADAQSLFYYLGQIATWMNAYTSNDATHYMTLGGGGQLDRLLQIEAMRLHYGCSTFTDADFQREREVVRNEIRQRTGTAEGQMLPQLVAAVYPEGHPSARMVGGDDVQIAALTLADVCDFVTKYYVPERATVIVVGGAAVQPTAALIEKWFGKLEKRAPGPRRPVPPVIVPDGRTTIELDVERPVVAVSWALPPIRTLADELVASEMLSRLSAVEEAAMLYGFAARVDAAFLGGRDARVVTLLVELGALDKLDEALDFVWKAARRDRTISEMRMSVEPEEARSRFRTGYIVGISPLERRANELGDRVQFTRDLAFSDPKPYLFHTLDELARLDIQGIEDTAKSMLIPGHAHVTVFRPSRTGIKGDRRADFVFSADPHDLGEPGVDPAEARRRIVVTDEVTLTTRARRLELGNGLHVVLLPVADAAFPVVSAQLVIGAGDAASPDRPWVAEATARFAIAPPQISFRAIRAGVWVGCSATLDHTICSSQGVEIYLPEMIEAIERKLRAGYYYQQGLEYWQKQTSDVVRRRREIADEELERQLLAGVYGADHPYTRAGAPPPGAVKNFGIDRMIAFRDAHYGAANATLVIAGSFDDKRAEALIRDHFGAWSRGRADPPIATPAAARAAPLYAGVIRDEGPQIDLAIAYPSPGGLGGQEAARQVMVEMLAGEARAVRERLGATYGTQVTRDQRRGPSRITLRTAVDAPRAGEALAALRAGVDAIRRGDDFDVRFVRARRRVIRRLIDESGASRELAQRLATIAGFGLGADHYKNLVAQVGALSTGQVKAVIAAELGPEREVVVASGDRAGLTAAFAAAGITDVTLVEPDYR
jgi:zinc protease